MSQVLYNVIIYPLTQIIEFAFVLSDKIMDSTGLALVGVSLAVSLLTLPLYAVAKQFEDEERDLQLKMKAQTDRIKKCFKGDEQYMILSTYYRQNHYHPIMQLRSAFGILIQIPFFTAAYACLSHMAALHGQSFLFIADLGKPDALFRIGGFTVNVLPLLMTAINCVSGAIYTKGLPLREKLQVYLLALLFVVLLYNSPAGLVVYWTMNNVFSLVKNIFYKFKNPLKVFYGICALAAAAAIVWVIFTRHFNFMTKVLMIVAFLVIIASPLIVRAMNAAVDKLLFPLRDNRRLRAGLFFAGAGAFTLLIGLVIPSLLIASSPVEFSGIDNYPDPRFFVRNTFVQALGLCFLWPSLVFFLFKERVQTILSALFLFLSLTAFANAFLFQGDYGYLSTLLVFTERSDVVSPAAYVVANLAVIAAIFVAVLAVIRLGLSRGACAVMGIACASLVMLSFVQGRKISEGYRDYLRVSAGTKADSIEPIFHFTRTGKNVVLIFLDRAQNRFVEPILAETPRLKDSFSGFTLYKNTVSYNSHTLIGAPPVHGGYGYTPLEMNRRSDVPLVEKHNEAILLLPRIFTEQAERFSAESSDASWANYSWIPDISIFKPYPKISAHVTENAYLSLWYDEHRDDGAAFTVASAVLKRNILWYAAFRAAPVVLRPVIYKRGLYWSADTGVEDVNKYLSCYSVMEYLPRLTDFDCTTENYFLSFTNNATHTSFMLQAPDYVPAAEVTNYGNSEYAGDEAYSSMAGVMHRLAEFFDYLKENGAYNNTRILVVSDHGSSGYEKDFQWDEKFQMLRPGRYHPLFMFKDFDDAGNFSTSDEFMTNADGPVMLLEGFVANPENPFTGDAVTNASKSDGALINTSNLFMPHHTKSKYVFTSPPMDWYRVSKSIFESENWKQEIVEEAE